MTGWEAYRRLCMKLAQVGFSTAPLSPDKFIEIANDQMFELNSRTTLMVAGDISFSTAIGQRRYRLTDGVSGPPLNILKIIRASHNGNPVWPEKPWQFIGDTEAGTDSDQGPPKHIWIETETYGPSGMIPVSEKCVGVFPLPDAIYPIHMVCRMPVPYYTNLNAQLPVRSDSHEAVLTNVMAELFAGKDFHDNAMKVVWEQKRQMAEAELHGWEDRQTIEHPPEISETTLYQVD